MKKYLLTWYGVADMRAALGLSTSKGPILSALESGDYTDVVILGYTNTDKDPDAFARMRNHWEERYAQPLNDGRLSAPAQDQELLDAALNTDAGHSAFMTSLQQRLAEEGHSPMVKFERSTLKNLNDADGIYRAAESALREVISDPAEKQITLYVSPGTPVMAFTWALLARSNPSLGLVVMASSEPQSPPQRVALPSVLLTSTVRPRLLQPKDSQAVKAFDLVIHLVGEQKMPVLFGIRQFTSNQTAFVTTAAFESSVSKFALATGVEALVEIIEDPFSVEDTRSAVEALAAKMPSGSRVAVNSTGGTKLMFAGALAACWEHDLEPFYIDINTHNVVFLRDDSSEPFVGITNVDEFVYASGFTVREKGRWPSNPKHQMNQRRSAAAALWTVREDLNFLYRSANFHKVLRDFNRPTRTPAERLQRGQMDFSLSWKDGSASITDGKATLVIAGQNFAVPTEGLFDFVAGGWFEEYLHDLLHPLQESGLIRDLRIGMTTGYTQDEKMLAQEFDAVFTDGKRLWIVECKAGRIQQDHIQKLENNLKQYGGVAARGIAASAMPLTRAARMRLSGLTSVTPLTATDVTTESLQAIITEHI